jgi:serine/threonine-protein kinase
VLDIGRDGLDVFVVTEDVRGTDAAAAIARGALPVPVACMVAASAAAGLAALHAQGVSHGAVSPEAVIQTADGTVRLTGAGLAAAEPPPDLRPGAPAAGARYLSPEEAAGGPGDAGSDVYRLGLVLYALLTGSPAFDGPDAATVAREHVDGVVQPPQFRNPAVPPALAQVVMRTLEKDPGRRESAAQLQQDLSAVLSAAQAQYEPEPQKPKNRGWIWAVAVLAVVAVIAVSAAWAAGVFSPDEPAAKVAVPDLTGMTQQGATSALDQAGLAVGTVMTKQTDAGPEGTVVAQDPAPGSKVSEGSKVALTVSGGASPSPPAPVAVPNVLGLTQAEALSALQQVGFAAVVTQASSLSPAGEVTSQSPSAGVMAQAGSVVELTVSSGPASQPATPSAGASP